MLINIYSAKCIGIEAERVTVEVDINAGIGIHLVGLADAAVKESLLRTMTALASLGFKIPGKKIVINLAPADVHKRGSGYDVPIALGIVAASGQIEMPEIDKYIIMGELGLDGSIRPVPGALPIAELAEREGFLGCILPEDSALEAADFSKRRVFGVKNLLEVIKIVCAEEDPSEYLVVNYAKKREDVQESQDYVLDFSEIKGQKGAKRGLEIAASGGHNAIMVGVPGCGKSSLAKAMAGILPPMTLEESIQTSKIYSVSGNMRQGYGLIRQRPFRAPHYTSSVTALLGGGSENILPGEVSLAHNGILFADEFCEAPKRMIEALRAPMEDRKVVISRLRTKVEYPASFMLVAATNPCPCGYYGEGQRCTCAPGKREAYLSKLSGPLMDRIDLHLWLHPVDAKQLIGKEPEETSAEVARRVLQARKIQEERFKDDGITVNAQMQNRHIDKYCPLSPECREHLEKLMSRMGLSARACSRILKISRTIADLSGEENIRLEHILEAAGYRFLDKQSIF